MENLFSLSGPLTWVLILKSIYLVSAIGVAVRMLQYLFSEHWLTLHVGDVVLALLAVFVPAANTLVFFFVFKDVLDTFLGICARVLDIKIWTRKRL